MEKGHIDELRKLAREIEQKASWHDERPGDAHLQRAIAYWACFDELSFILGDIKEGAA
jgi:hypothetical protein